MPRARVGELELEYDTIGSSDDPAVLLVMGLGAQLIHWHKDFCQRLADGGFQVIRFDNRDAGLSTKLDGVQVDFLSLVAAALDGQEVFNTPYELSDMANDAFGILDELDINQAHIVGASLGGMIAQTMAIEQPDRVLSLTSIMSATGTREVMDIPEDSLALLLAPTPTERSAYIAYSAEYAIWSSKRYFDLQLAQEHAAVSFDRCNYPDGAGRQIAAMLASGDREPHLAKLKVPTLVIHGRDDRLVLPALGARTADVIPRSNYLLVSDMGHDLPEPLWPVVIDAIHSHMRSSSVIAG
jgi:pimeloyl-ACP methyl ester carboxylesterase|tara:strand:- start:200 stop:1090 length:891 start_codon:yes stop_codon:yes gene_type:complete